MLAMEAGEEEGVKENSCRGFCQGTKKVLIFNQENEHRMRRSIEEGNEKIV